MNAISRPTDGPEGSTGIAAAPDTGLTTDVVVRPNRPATYLRHLRRIVRQPFALRLPRPRLRGGAVPIGDAIAEDVRAITETETADFAFSVAELALRLDAMSDRITDEDARQGLAVLDEVARMYEHIFILQTEG